MSSRAPLIVAIALLLLPVVYVVSYLALVAPRSVVVSPRGILIMSNYRVAHRVLPIVFLPLEQIDRKIRPQVWNPIRELVGPLPLLRNPLPDEDVPIIQPAAEVSP